MMLMLLMGSSLSLVRPDQQRAELIGALLQLYGAVLHFANFDQLAAPAAPARQPGRGARTFDTQTLTGYAVLVDVAASAGLHDPGAPISFTPHDFRRLLATAIVSNGLRLHITAIFPEGVVAAHQQFIERRRATSSGAELRTATAEDGHPSETGLFQLGRGLTEKPSGDDQLLDLLSSFEDVEDLAGADRRLWPVRTNMGSDLASCCSSTLTDYRCLPASHGAVTEQSRPPHRDPWASRLGKPTGQADAVLEGERTRSLSPWTIRCGSSSGLSRATRQQNPLPASLRRLLYPDGFEDLWTRRPTARRRTRTVGRQVVRGQHCSSPEPAMKVIASPNG
jgi:hypothetical protein